MLVGNKKDLHMERFVAFQSLCVNETLSDLVTEMPFVIENSVVVIFMSFEKSFSYAAEVRPHTALERREQTSRELSLKHKTKSARAALVC